MPKKGEKGAGGGSHVREEEVWAKGRLRGGSGLLTDGTGVTGVRERGVVPGEGARAREREGML